MPTDEPADHERPLPLDPDIETGETTSGLPLAIHLNWRFIFLVGVGGACGTAARHLLGDAIGTTHDFPLGTFLINIFGAFALGVLLECLARSGSDAGHRRLLRLLLGTGFLGGFTTYSALAVDADTLLRTDHLGLALAYAGGTVAMGLMASVAGIAIARKVVRS
ncbi:MAG: CrcB family protein [Kineosporiaceae bacterium]|nr:CrcB family protein [Aeromicrobium sp.]